MTADKVRVGDVSEQVRGVSYAKGDASATPQQGYLPVLRAGNITESGVVFDDLVYVPATRVSQKQLLRAGDVLIAASSGSLDVVGKAAPVLSDYEGAFGAFCKVLRPNAKRVDTRYFSHFFRTAGYRRIVSSLAAGANINNLRNEHLDDLDLPLPPIAQQRQIATILDKAEALRAKRQEALAQLSGLAQSIFSEMFGDPATNPKGWAQMRLSELVAKGDSINYGVVQPGDDVEDGVPLVRVGDLANGQVCHEALKRIAPGIECAYGRSRLTGDEILVSCVGSIGVVALASPRESGFNIARAVARIRVNESVDREFIAAQLGTPAVQRYFTRELRTVSQPTLNIKQLAETQVLCPPLKMQRLFASRIAAVRAVRERLVRSLHLAHGMFEALQRRAFEGDLLAQEHQSRRALGGSW